MQILASCSLSDVPLAVISTAFPTSFLHIGGQLKHPAFNASLLSNASHLSTCLRNGTSDSIEARLSFLASLHKLTHVRQDFPGLPSAELVETYSPNLLTLVDWKIRNQKLEYPHLHVSKVNESFQCLEDWILTSLQIKDSYRSRLAEVEAQYLDTLEKSREALVLSGNPSPGKLYNWISSLLVGTQYEPDSYGWLRTLFLAKDTNTVLFFDRDEVLLACEIIESHLPLGTGLGPSVRKRLAELRGAIATYYVDVEELERSYEEETLEEHKARQDVRTAEISRLVAEAPSLEPKQKDYPNVVAYMQAKAKWNLAQRKS